MPFTMLLHIPPSASAPVSDFAGGLIVGFVFGALLAYRWLTAKRKA